MTSKFEPEADPATTQPAGSRLFDPEAYDASEQIFAASIEEGPGPPRFVLDDFPEGSENKAASSPLVEGEESGVLSAEEPLESQANQPPGEADLPQPPASGSWRGEVAARVNNYRARRRPREPRYPSLQLRFDPPMPADFPVADLQAPATPPVNHLAVALQDPLLVREDRREHATEANPVDDGANAPDTTGKILEFPRSAGAPVLVADELAEPVTGRPRILEVPETLPPPPALGGMLIEAADEPAKERRPGFELPLRSAAMSKRLLAGAIDSMLVISAFALFAYIFFRVTAFSPAVRQAASISVILTVVLWAAYQYVFLVYTGTTPGLKLASLRLSRFDGTAVPRRIRRWRVLASLLSGLSLALGYAWCFMDEDQLCWHDRITRTYMEPQTVKSERPR